ncbi:MAG: twin-arginine translocase TatA/TatE family subunit [bacterium]|nr:twin-arginine translocase TatA/TatE family subunit [bacterium]
MFGPLGVPEIILIFCVALLLFGPRQMPQIGRTIGRALGEFRRASNDFKRTIEDEVAMEEIRDVEKDLRSASAEAVGFVREVADETVHESEEVEDSKDQGESEKE